MICVQSPLKREYIIELLNNKIHDDIEFQYDRTEQMKIFFNHTGDADHAASLAKKVIKKSEFGSALFFTVSHD